ncbi:MAG: hypothetical protein LBJ00_09320 [Planctomycetaceae bacterium]|nr:hypothetical protein [Planctomycetaceae bacterium]
MKRLLRGEAYRLTGYGIARWEGTVYKDERLRTICGSVRFWYVFLVVVYKFAEFGERGI